MTPVPADRRASPCRRRDNPLDALERAWRRFADERTLVRRGGRITEVSPTHYRVRGLSGVARLGDMVEHRSRAGMRHGEIVQISPDEVLVAPFERAGDAGVGDAVFDLGPFAIAPHASWRGRAIDALARPIDGGRPLPQGDPLDAALAAQPPALARQRVGSAFAHRRQGHRHLHADLLRPAARHLRRLRRRQVDAARHARRGAAPSTRSSSRWSASAAARCANSSRTRSARTAWPRPSPSSRPATKAP